MKGKSLRELPSDGEAPSPNVSDLHQGYSTSSEPFLCLNSGVHPVEISREVLVFRTPPASQRGVLMSGGRSFFLFVLFFSVSFPFAAKKPASSSPQALALLQKSLAALTGGQSITDVTLSGTARRIAGSDDESGSATLKALASGAGRMDLSLSSGQRSEVENFSATPPAGSWSGPDS